MYPNVSHLSLYLKEIYQYINQVCNSVRRNESNQLEKEMSLLMCLI